MSGLTLAGTTVTSIEESQDPKIVELLSRENTRWIKSFHEKAWARDEMFGSYTIKDGDEQMEMSSEFPSTAIWVSRSTSDMPEVKKNYDAPKMKFIAPADGASFPKPKILSKLAGRSSSPEADAKDLLSYAPASYHTSTPLSLAPSSPSAKWTYVPPARRTGINPSQPSSPSTSPPSSPAWQPSPSAGSTGWRRNLVTSTSPHLDSCANAMAGAPTPGAGLKTTAPFSNSWRNRSTESNASKGSPMTACQRSCQARLRRQERLLRRSS